MKLPTSEEKREKGDTVQVFEYCAISTEQFFKIRNNRSVIGNKDKVSKKQITKDAKIYLYSRRVMDTWNRLCEETLNADSIKRFKILYDSKESLKDETQQVLNPFPILHK